GGELRPLEGLTRGIDVSRWERHAGMALSDIVAFVGYGAPPDIVTIWFLPSESRAQAAFEALKSRGFHSVGAGSDPVLANGEPGHIDLEQRQWDNPWRGPLGMTSAVTWAGPLLLQANAPDKLTAWRDARPSPSGNVTSHPGVDVALKG